MNVHELMQEAIRFDEPFLAYALYWGIRNDVIQGIDNADEIDFNVMDVDAVSEMISRNELGIEVIRLYSMRMEDGRFAIILAKKEADARGKFLTEFGKLPKRIIDISEKMDTDFYFEKVGYRSIREIKESVIDLPYLVMVYQK